MKRNFVLYLVASAIYFGLIISAPAPVMEEPSTPTPARTPKRSAAANPRFHNDKPSATRPSKNSFAGTWRGLIHITGDLVQTVDWTFVISPDEKRISMSTTGSGASTSSPCFRQGNVLHIVHDKVADVVDTATIVLDPKSGTAVFNETASAHVLFFGAKANYNGTLIRQN